VIKARTIITADPELDDLNSMIRLLLHSNELEIEGLIYASSQYHWKGDGRGTTFFQPDREYDRPQTAWRWAAGERFIDDAVDAYAAVHANLVVHDPDYPSPDALRAVICEGNIAFEGDTSFETPGSRLIAEALLDDRPGPIHIQAWAGTSTIARALMSIEAAYSDSENWPVLRAEISRKAIISKYGSQDATYEEYISPRWPDMCVVDVTNGAWGYWIRHVVLPEDRELLESEWMTANITSVGPLGRLYRVWGDGRRMVDGDASDYFHLSGVGRDELTAQGFRVWTEPCPAGEWISEGDTANMLNLFDNGLRGHEHPSFGGWGGRGARDGVTSNSWDIRLAHDAAPDGGTPPEYSLSRWFRAAQNDIAERLRWSISPSYDDANHHPRVVVKGALDREEKPGASVELSAHVTHPNGNDVVVRWWQYREAGSYPLAVDLHPEGTGRVRFIVPEDAAPGQTLHLILEATDAGSRPLTSYARVIITVR
jgi:hypothetical protein